jgi:hypothetical protein
MMSQRRDGQGEGHRADLRLYPIDEARRRCGRGRRSQRRWRCSLNAICGASVVLTLEDACIETTARRAYRELTAALLDGHASAATVEATAETLAAFLASTDFAVLRAEHPELAGGTRCHVRLRREGDTVRWELVELR